MKTVHEVSKLTGVSIRTLQYYDRIGLLKPSQRTEAGYRLYDDTALERLQQILLFRELAFPLEEIRAILDAPGFDRQKALTQQIELLTMKKQRLEAIIGLARALQEKGGTTMDFEAFDTGKLEAYKAQARAQWGSTKEYAEYEARSKDRSAQQEQDAASALMQIFAEFGQLREQPAGSEAVRAQVQKLQRCITDNYYTCSDEMLLSLGQMYTADASFRQNIDKAGGEGTAAFVNLAIRAYCGR